MNPNLSDKGSTVVVNVVDGSKESSEIVANTPSFLYLFQLFCFKSVLLFSFSNEVYLQYFSFRLHYRQTKSIMYHVEQGMLCPFNSLLLYAK